MAIVKPFVFELRTTLNKTFSGLLTEQSGFHCISLEWMPKLAMVQIMLFEVFLRFVLVCLVENVLISTLKGLILGRYQVTFCGNCNTLTLLLAF